MSESKPAQTFTCDTCGIVACWGYIGLPLDWVKFGERYYCEKHAADVKRLEREAGRRL